MIPDWKSGDKIHIKLLSNIDMAKNKMLADFPGHILELNGTFHFKLFLHLDDSPKIILENLIMDLNRTFE